MEHEPGLASASATQKRLLIDRSLNTPEPDEKVDPDQRAVFWQNILDLQKAFFQSGMTQDLRLRKLHLQMLKQVLETEKDEILNALWLDLGKNQTEGYMSELGLVLSSLDWQISHLGRNARAHLHWTPLHEFPAISKTIDIPYGNVLIMAPWNYPFLLAMEPLIEAIAAGNTVILKTGHAAVHTSAVIKKICTLVFDDDYVAVAEGGRKDIQALLALHFDYLFFTGGKKLGALVYEAAAKNMTPVTLELGGKSPAVIDESANLALAARRIVFGKFLNAGQTCVAPDYVVVHESVAEPFLALLEKEIHRQYPRPEDIGKIINVSRYDHLLSLVNPEKVVTGGAASRPTLQIEPTVLFPADWDDPAMQEEIFGPILPVLVYSDFRDLMKTLAALPTPLAFYLFSRTRLHQRYVERIQPFGGGCINDTVIQLSSEELPFGGMGASGIGQYHGRWGYQTFSHTKAIVQKGQWLDLPMRYNDRKPWMEKLIRLFLH